MIDSRRPVSPFRSTRARWAIGCALLLGGGVGCAAETGDDFEIDTIQEAIETFPNQEPAYRYFVAKGLTPAQSAGIIGNLSAESGMNPAIHQLGGGPGRGLAQWQAGGRWDTTNPNVTSFAAQRGADRYSLQLQLDFIWHELTVVPAFGLAELRATTTARDATLVFMRKYEGCSACATTKRLAYAEDVLARFGGTSGGSSSSSSSGSSSVSCTIDTGEVGECLPTATCAALGSSISTPGFCPGAADIQCCTTVDDEEPEPGTGSSSSGGSTNTPDGGGQSAPDPDRDPGASGGDDTLPGVADEGCSTTGRTTPHTSSLLCLLGVTVWMLRSRRRAC